MALTEVEKAKIWRGIMSHWSRLNEEMGDISKSQLSEVISAIDDWIEANQTSFNSALPEPARTRLTASQKSVLFCGVLLMRVNITFLRRVFGEVD